MFLWLTDRKQARRQPRCAESRVRDPASGVALLETAAGLASAAFFFTDAYCYLPDGSLDTRRSETVSPSS
jgi:hypothetical protein